MSIGSKVSCNVCGWSDDENKVSNISGMLACPRCFEVEDLDFSDDFEEEPTEEELRESEKEDQDISLEALKNNIQEICEEDYIENDNDDELLCNTCGWVGNRDELDRDGISSACPNCYEDEDLELLEE